MDVLETLNDGDEIDTFFLSVLYKKVPNDVKEALLIHISPKMEIN